MLTPHYKIHLREVEPQQLQALVRAGKTPQQLVLRAPLILRAQADVSTQQIADAVGTSRHLVQQWRNRFALYEPPPRLAQQESDPVARVAALPDLPRSGRPPACSPAGAPHGRGHGVPRH